MTTRASVFHDEFRRRYEPVDYQVTFAAGADPSATDIIPKKTGYATRIVRMTFNCTTSAAQTLTIQDDADTPVVAGVFASNPGVGTHQISFEPQGIEMTEGKNVDLVASAAGLAGTLLVEGYYVPVGPFSL